MCILRHLLFVVRNRCGSLLCILRILRLPTGDERQGDDNDKRTAANSEKIPDATLLRWRHLRWILVRWLLWIWWLLHGLSPYQRDTIQSQFSVYITITLPSIVSNYPRYCARQRDIER